MPAGAGVLRWYGRECLDLLGEARLPGLRRAIEALPACRTAPVGGPRCQGAPWGHEPSVYHSCRNRSCPKWYHHDAEAWPAERRQELCQGPTVTWASRDPRRCGRSAAAPNRAPTMASAARRPKGP